MAFYCIIFHKICSVLFELYVVLVSCLTDANQNKVYQITFIFDPLTKLNRNLKYPLFSGIKGTDERVLSIGLLTVSV
jgi:hypothetical protein